MQGAGDMLAAKKAPIRQIVGTILRYARTVRVDRHAPSPARPNTPSLQCSAASAGADE